MAERKPFLLRIDPELLAALQRWAADDLRSLNAQIEFLLRDAVRRAGRDRRSKARPARAPTIAHPARVSELADDGALKAPVPEGTCGFESHPGHRTRARRRLPGAGLPTAKACTTGPGASGFDWLVVGAGLSGATLAERIASRLGERVLVVDRRTHVAGNAYDCSTTRVCSSTATARTSSTRARGGSGFVGATGNRIESTLAANQDQQIALRGQLSEIEDVDLASATMELQLQEVAYQATLAAMGRALQPSLADFLR